MQQTNHTAGSKALVTGADGLLGSHLVRELIERGVGVRALIQPGSRSPTLDGLPIDRIEGDLLSGDEGLKNAVRGCRFAFHCAALTDMWAGPEITWKVNLEGTRSVLDACVTESVERLVWVGSASCFQFGTIDRPGDESGPFPAAYRGVPYMESKQRAMELVREYIADKSLDAVIAVPTFLIGGHDFRPSSGELIRQFIKRGLKFASPGGRNFVYAADVARAMVSALEKGEKGKAYILAGENLTYLDFFARVARFAGVEPPRRVLPRTLVLAAGAAGSLFGTITGRPAALNLRMARFSCMGTYYSPARAKRELGMTHTPIDSCIEESIRSLRGYGYI